MTRFNPPTPIPFQQLIHKVHANSQLSHPSKRPKDQPGIMSSSQLGKQRALPHAPLKLILTSTLICINEIPFQAFNTYHVFPVLILNPVRPKPTCQFVSNISKPVRDTLSAHDECLFLFEISIMKI
jgi:hypothetical protein